MLQARVVHCHRARMEGAGIFNHSYSCRKHTMSPKNRSNYYEPTRKTTTRQPTENKKGREKMQFYIYTIGKKIDDSVRDFNRCI